MTERRPHDLFTAETVPELAERHLEEIAEARSRDAYMRLVRACESRPGGVDDAMLMLIADYARLENLKQLLIADINTRGLGREYFNSKQKYYKRNESIGDLKNAITQQAQLLKALKLTPEARKLDVAGVDIAGDELNDF